MSNRDIKICRDADDLYRKGAEQFVTLARRAAQASGRFTCALSGGSTPRGLYSLLATPEYREQIPWSQIHFFWGDERCVPPDHADSNYRMARQALLSKISIPVDNIHRMMGEKEPLVAAVEYEEQLEKFFHLAEGVLPRFDLILLGLGEEGHTASLFPGSDALAETKRLVTNVYVEKLKAHRLTLTLPALNHGAQIVFLVAGKSKATIVHEIFETKTGSALPAARVQPTDGQLTWHIAQDAAANLRSEIRTAG